MDLWTINASSGDKNTEKFRFRPVVFQAIWGTEKRMKYKTKGTHKKLYVK